MSSAHNYSALQYLQELQGCPFTQCMAFLNTAKDCVEVWIVYQHVIDMFGADWSFYAATNGVYSTLKPEIFVFFKSRLGMTSQTVNPLQMATTSREKIT